MDIEKTDWIFLNKLYFCIRKYKVKCRMSLGITSNKEKVEALLAYLCVRIPDMQLRKLLKILYLIDEESVRLRAIPVTWLEYHAWEKGPVAYEVYDVKNGAFADCLRCEKKEDNKWHVNALVKHAYLLDDNLKKFSQWEMALVNRIIERCENLSADQLTDETHIPNSLWSQTVKENDIDFSKDPKSNFVVDLNRLNDESGAATYEDAMECMQMQAFLNECN